ncbi:MAG: DnaJ domain-containing protein [Amoebophilaceae bacterium]|nr:DnaJ domain-containing protein [Amoebophilaceae bacterium]
MYSLCFIYRIFFSFLPTLLGIQLFLCSWRCFGGSDRDQQDDRPDQGRHLENQFTHTKREYMQGDNGHYMTPVHDPNSYLEAHPMNDLEAQETPCDSLMLVEEKQPIQAGEREIIARKIIKRLIYSWKLKPTDEKPLLDILNKTKEEKILDTIVEAIFSRAYLLSWDRMLTDLGYGGIDVANLYDLGLSPNIQDGFRRVILAYKIDQEWPEANEFIDLLLKKGSIISPPNAVVRAYHSTILQIAFRRKDAKQMVPKLLKYNAATGMSLNEEDGDLLVKAIAEGYDAAVVELFIKQGADVNQYNGTHTPLLAAIGRGDKAFDIVELLIKHGVDLNFRLEVSCFGVSRFPLDHVNEDEAPKIFKLLRDEGARLGEEAFRSNHNTKSNLPLKNPAHPAEVIEAIETLNKYFTEPITAETPLTRIETLYRKAALRYHPDKHSSDSDDEKEKYTGLFQKLTDAMNTVRDYMNKSKK